MKNNYQIIGDTVAIHIPRKNDRDLICLIDLEDLPKAMIIEDTWRYGFNGSKTSTTVYTLRPCGTKPNGKVKYKKIILSRVVMYTPKDMVCHHVNSNTLDCRKSNLRNCTVLENNRNRRGKHIPPHVLVR